MNSTVKKSVYVKDSVFGTGPFKKQRRRRYRNKSSGLKRKKLKKFHPLKKSSNLKSKLGSEKIMSDWYWSNYRKAVEWQDRHKIAHWKACALALLEENRYLLQIINSMHPDMVPEVSVTQSLGEGMNYNPPHLRLSKNFVSSHNRDKDAGDDNSNEDDEEENDEANEDFEFEMSEEMIKFFEQSYKHKMDLKKLKEKEMMESTEQEIKKIQTNKLKRSTEMNLLYGDGASMIIGMETAVQLSFDKYCDTKSPKFWPNIPFRL